MQDALNELELTPRRLLSIFWLFIWRGVVGAFAIGAVIGFVLGLGFSLVFGGDQPWTSTLIGTFSGIAGFAWQVVAMRMALRKRYRDFRIAIAGI
jgi:hypothetical protein